MAQPYIGQIVPVAFPFAPRGWLICDGSLQPIAQYTSLFNLIGTTYGGDGMSQFALPDLRGRTAISFGRPSNPRLSSYTLGQSFGVEQVALAAANAPPHSHALSYAGDQGTLTAPAAGAALGAAATLVVNVYRPSAFAPTVGLAPATISTTPGGAPHENRQPFQVINYIIAWDGVYPSR